MSPGSGEDYAHGARVVRLGKGAEENVDWCAALLDAVNFGKHEMTIGNGQTLIRRDHVNMIGLYFDRFSNLLHRHCCGVLQHFGKFAVVIRRKMQDYNVSHTAIGWNMSKELFKRIDATGRSTNPDDQKLVA